MRKHLSMNPLKQGLKLAACQEAAAGLGAFIHESIKTRVETNLRTNRRLHKAAFIHESIKTRVETL